MPAPTCIFCYAEFPHDPTDFCITEFAEAESISGPAKMGAPVKMGDEMVDVLSTGRKRAVEIAIIEKGMVCEWALLKEAGGGAYPIQGCPGNPAKDVHHGPDKSVLNNDLGTNLHRICKSCHNRWHAANNKTYINPRPEAGAEWRPDPSLCGNNEIKEHNIKDKMTQFEALMLEASRTKV